MTNPHATEEAFAPVDFADVSPRDRLRFATVDSVGGRGTYWRTGVVVRVTPTVAMVVCDNRTRAFLRRDDWGSRTPERAAQGGQP